MSTNAVLDRLAAERSTVIEFIDQTMGAVDAESRDLSDTELRALDTQRGRLAEIDAQIDPLTKFLAMRESAAKLPGQSRPTASPSPRPEETRSLGQIYTESAEFAAYQGRGSSTPVEIPEFRAVGPDPLLTNTTPGSVLLGTNKDRLNVMGHFVAFPLLSIVGRIESSQNSVELVTTGDASGADVVAEGAQKPAVAWTASSTTVTLATVAGWFKHSRQAQRDIPGLRDLIDQKIRRAIDVKLNSLATTALGTAFTGGNTTTGAAGVPLIELIRGAIASLEVRGISTAGAVVLVNPTDAAAIDIAMTKSTAASGSGMVLYGSYWGLPVIPVNGVTAGTAIVGDVNEALAWIYKGGLSMFTTDSDVTDGATVKSDFRANILTTLGEVFGVFAVTDASVLQKVVATP